MSLSLKKNIYNIDDLSLYRISTKVDGVDTNFLLQCKQSKTDEEIEVTIKEKLISRGYISSQLTTVIWE